MIKDFKKGDFVHSDSTCSQGSVREGKNQTHQKNVKGHLNIDPDPSDDTDDRQGWQLRTEEPHQTQELKHGHTQNKHLQKNENIFTL